MSMLQCDPLPTCYPQPNVKMKAKKLEFSQPSNIFPQIFPISDWLVHIYSIFAAKNE